MNYRRAQDHLDPMMLPPRVWKPSYVWPVDNEGVLRVVEGHQNPEIAEHRRHRQWLKAMGQETGPEVSHFVSAVSLDNFRIPEYDRYPTLQQYQGMSPIHEEFLDLIPEQLNVTGHGSLELPPLVVHSDSEYSTDDDSEGLEKSLKTGNSPITPIIPPDIDFHFELIAPPGVDDALLMPLAPVYINPPNTPMIPAAPVDVNSLIEPIVPVYVNPPNTPITTLHVNDCDGPMMMIMKENVDTTIVDTIIEAASLSRSQKSKHIDGWLGSEQSSKGPVAAFRRSTVFLKGLGKKFLKQEFSNQTFVAIEEVTKKEQMVDGKDSPPPLPPKDRLVTPPKPSPVSLGPCDQALLYSRLEFMICETANAFLVQQYCDNRIDQHTISQVINGWAAKNLPRVPEFRFDQATQRDLINANRRTMEFTGLSSTNTVQLVANLRSWKSIIQDMNHRTFCLRDSAIRKQLYEIGQILDMLNAPSATLQAFDELHAGVLRFMITTPGSPSSSLSS